MTGARPNWEENPMPFGSMEGEGAAKIALKSVSVKGELHGLLFEHTISQVYENETDEILEIIYTFPLGFDTALLGMSAKIGDKELTGQVVGKSEAAAKYEEALDKGDSAILLEQSAAGLYTANLGNIKGGEKVVVDLHCAKLLTFDGDRVRLAIPTVISQRYGDEHGQGRLAPHETAAVDPKAKYDFALDISLYGEIAKAKVTCPSHNIQSKPIEGGLSFSLDGAAALDRDFVLLLEDIANNTVAQYVTKDGETLVAASFAPSLPEDEFTPIALKILVDCSGSMSGDRISQARVGLKKVLSELGGRDFVSYSRFGNDVVRKTEELLPCTGRNLEKLGDWIQHTDADLGGTELERALRDTFRLGEESELPGMILLITDGDVWAVDEIIATAKKFGQRIFVIGVGTTSSEHLLRNLGEKTGGACELVSSNEKISEAVLRMFKRMRGVLARNIEIDWQAKTIWQSRKPKFLYNGETGHCFALMPTPPEKAPTLTWETEDGRHTAQAEAIEQSNSSDLFRVGMKRRMEEAPSKAQQELAVKYQLISEKTSFILTYERASDDKAIGIPHVQQVPQMPTHGHGLFGAVLGGAAAIAGMACAPAPSFFGMRHFASRSVAEDIMDSSPFDKDEVVSEEIRVKVQVLLEMWRDGLYKSTSAEECFKPIRSMLGFELDEFLSDLADDLGLNHDVLWGLFIQYVLEDKGLLDRHSKRLLKPLLQNVTPSEQKLAYEHFEDIVLIG